MLETMTRLVLLAALALAPLGCGDGDKAPEKKAKDEAAEAADKTEAGKPKLDPTNECATYFEANQKGGAKDAFMAACVKDISLIACTGPAASSGFCTRAKEDAAKKQLIEDMVAGLGL
jgi:hypothetical protein